MYSQWTLRDTVIIFLLGVIIILGTVAALENRKETKTYQATCFSNTFTVKAKSVKYGLAGGCLEFKDPFIYVCGCNVLVENVEVGVKK